MSDRPGRAWLEAGIAALLAAGLSLIVFWPLLGQLSQGWAGGDLLSTYANADAWGGFGYALTEHFGYPLGMNLNYFPGIDITENLFAQLVTNLTGTAFLGINLLIVLTFPLVAALAVWAIRLTGLRGPLAIALAVAFTLIPFHWGRSLGHMYLATLYSAVTGLIVVLLVGSGRWSWWLQQGRRWVGLMLMAVLVIVTAWTGVYYVAFTLLLGLMALAWRLARGAQWRMLLMDVLPFAAIAGMAVVGFLPSLLTLRADPPLVPLGERTPIESVTFAGNLAFALLPLPQSQLPGLDAYNSAVFEAIQAAPYGESTALTNFGTWVTTLALLVMVLGLILRTRRPDASPMASDGMTAPQASLGFIAALIVWTVLFFVPWGLNYLFAGVVTAQIRAWNRLIPLLLLLFILGAAAALAQTSWRRWSMRAIVAIPLALLILAITAIDSVVPFREPYTTNVATASAQSGAAVQYAGALNAAIPEQCAVLQLPYVPYPEAGDTRGMPDYEHFWTALANREKFFTYGAVRATDASVWAQQLAQVPGDATIEILRQAGFCAIHVDTRGYYQEEIGPLLENLTARFGSPVATAADGQWQAFAIGAPTIPVQWSDGVAAYFAQALIVPDEATTGPRYSELDHAWWWTRAEQGSFQLMPIHSTAPIDTVRGSVMAAVCFARPVTITLAAGEQQVSATIVAEPNNPQPFELKLPAATTEPANLRVYAPGESCDDPSVPNQADGSDAPNQYVQIRDVIALGPVQAQQFRPAFPVN